MSRETIVSGEIAFIPLTKGHTAIIDAADVHLVEGLNWCANETKYKGVVKSVYALRNITLPDGKAGKVYLHRLIMSAPDDMHVDHIYGNGLDCRRSNMRMASRSENMHNGRSRINNTSGVKGVSWHKQCGKWEAQITVNYENIKLGLFSSLADAAQAYAQASAKYHGEFGRLG